MGLAERFLSALPPGARAAISARPEGVETILERLRRAHAAYPDVKLDDAAFLTFLAGRISPEAADPADRLQIEELFVAAAALEGDRAALARVNAVCTRVVAREATRARATGLVDDVRQAVEQILLVRASGAPPALAQYSGKGELAAWIRVIAVRELLRLKKREQRGPASADEEDDALALAAAPGSAPELHLLRSRYRDAFRAAFRDAVNTLQSRERLLLRQHFIDGLSLDALARLHQVHRATIARWIAQAREAIAGGTRDRLRAHLEGQPAGLDSVLQVVGSQLEVSLGALLRTLHS